MISYHDIKVWLYSENIYDFRILCNISCVIYYIQITDGTVISKSQTGLIQPPNPDYFRAFTYILYHTSWSLQGPEHCHIDFCTCPHRPLPGRGASAARRAPRLPAQGRVRHPDRAPPQQVYPDRWPAKARGVRRPARGRSHSVLRLRLRLRQWPWRGRGSWRRVCGAAGAHDQRSRAAAGPWLTSCCWTRRSSWTRWVAAR